MSQNWNKNTLYDITYPFSRLLLFSVFLSLSFLFHWKFRWAGNSSNLSGSRFLMQNRTVWDWSTTTAFIASWERERERERECGSKEGWEFYNIIIIVSVLMQMVTYLFLSFRRGGRCFCMQLWRSHDYLVLLLLLQHVEIIFYFYAFGRLHLDSLS